MIEIPEFFVKMVSGMRRMGLKNSRAEKESGTPHSAAGDVGINRMMVAFFLRIPKKIVTSAKFIRSSDQVEFFIYHGGGVIATVSSLMPSASCLKKRQ